MLLVERRSIFSFFLLVIQDVYRNALDSRPLEAKANSESPWSESGEVSQHLEVNKHLHADLDLHLLENKYVGRQVVVKQCEPIKIDERNNLQEGQLYLLK